MRAMRIGENPAKSAPAVRSDALVRVVVPVYIPGTIPGTPDGSGYFAEAAAIVERCLDSLARTGGPDTRITVVANGCAPAVVERLVARQQAGLVDQVLVSAENLGKVDGFLAGARGSWEPVVVVSDSDVLWRPGWPAALTAVLDTFPECALVSASPGPHLVRYATSTVILDAAARRSLRRRGVVDPAELQRFEESVGTPGLFDGQRDQQWLLERDGVVALVGGGHFAFALRRSALSSVSAGPVLGWEREALDVPLDRDGWWRLSTPEAYALHLGNKLEPWMDDEIAADEARVAVEPATPGRRVRAGRPSALRHVPYGVRTRAAVATLALAARRRPDRGT